MIVDQLLIAKFERHLGGQRLSISKAHLAKLLRKGGSFESQSERDHHTFKDWVYRLEHRAREPFGAARRSFLDQARTQISNVLDRIADGKAGAWDLVCCDNGTDKACEYQSFILQRDGRPLVLKPDAVFKNRAADLWVVLEYKIPTPGVRIPLEGWPNLAAQLWTYAWIGPWANSQNVLLVGAIFDWDGVSAKLSTVMPRTTKTDRSLGQACLSLFRLWGGDAQISTVFDPTLRNLLREQESE